MTRKDSVAPHESATLPAADGAGVVTSGGKTTAGTPLGSAPMLGVGAGDPKPRSVADGPDVGSGVARPPVGCVATDVGAGVSGEGAVLHPQSITNWEPVGL